MEPFTGMDGMAQLRVHNHQYSVLTPPFQFRSPILTHEVWAANPFIKATSFVGDEMTSPSSYVYEHLK